MTRLAQGSRSADFRVQEPLDCPSEWWKLVPASVLYQSVYTHTRPATLKSTRQHPAAMPSSAQKRTYPVSPEASRCINMTDSLRLAERQRTYVPQRPHHTAGAGTPRSCRGLCRTHTSYNKMLQQLPDSYSGSIPSKVRQGYPAQHCSRGCRYHSACAEVIYPTARPSPSCTDACKCLSGPVIQEALM